MTKTWDTQIDRIRQSQSEALALRLELAKQAATPRGQLQAENDRLRAAFEEQERERGRQAMAEAKRIHAESPHIPVEMAFNNMVANRAGDGLTLEAVLKLAEGMTPEELGKKFAKDYADDPSA